MGVINTQSLPNAEVLTNEQIEELLPHLDGIIGWAKQIQDYASISNLLHIHPRQF